MKKMILGLIAGVLLASAFYVPLLFQEQRRWHALGVNTGRVAGLAEATQALQKEFGVHAEEPILGSLFEVKTSAVVVVELPEGGKGLRVIP